MASCANCGNQNDDKASFCTYCGSQMGSVKVQQQPQQQQRQTASSSTLQGNANAKCLWCNQSAGFKEEEGKIDSKWGVTAHKVKIFICNNCGYAHIFGLGRTIWDFD